VTSLATLGLAAFLLFLLVNLIFPFEVDLRYSTVVTANDGTVLHAFLSPDDKWRMKLEPAELTPELRNALVKNGGSLQVRARGKRKTTE